MAEDEQELINESIEVSKPEQSKPWESQQVGNKMDDFHIAYKVLFDDLEGKWRYSVVSFVRLEGGGIVDTILAAFKHVKGYIYQDYR